MGQKIADDDPYFSAPSPAVEIAKPTTDDASDQLMLLLDVRMSLAFALRHLDSLKEFSLGAYVSHCIERLDDTLISAGINPELTDQPSTISARLAALEYLVEHHFALSMTEAKDRDRGRDYAASIVAKTKNAAKGALSQQPLTLGEHYSALDAMLSRIRSREPGPHTPPDS